MLAVNKRNIIEVVKENTRIFGKELKK